MSTATPPPPHANDRRIVEAALWGSIERLRARQASWRFRLFAPWWEREAAQHALTVLLREVERPAPTHRVPLPGQGELFEGEGA